ncbi:MAG: PD-(D/E)XK nuclease family protein [Candidatus Daviesbacteria bacterium]|nr:MAG: PD-(D/E)XK nuclease family protein [Candidatus Daviesbacteria bacterium]
MVSSNNKYIKNALFLSYTSLSDFLKCPHSFYLKNLYRDPKSGHRLQIASPYLSLGSTVHDAIKWFLEIQGQANLDQLIKKYRNLWLKFTGKRGGFASREEEAVFGKRGLLMMENFYKNWQILGKSAPHINFPKYNLVENVVLTGNFDFVGEKKDGTLWVVDFKTGVTDKKDPLQLYLYAILAENNFGKKVTQASFWYLDRESSPSPVVLEPLEGQVQWLQEKGQEVKKAVEKGQWVCIKNEMEDICNECQIYQALKDGQGEFQFSDFRFKKDVYYLNKFP